MDSSQDCYYINLTYETPYEDLERSLNFNMDGTINTKVSLISMRNLLQDNVAILNMLIEKADDIESVESRGVNMIEVKIPSQQTADSLLGDSTIVRIEDHPGYHPLPLPDDEEGFRLLEEYMNNVAGEAPPLPTEPEETNMDRLDRIRQMVHQDGGISDVFSDSESSENELISDPQIVDAIIRRYKMAAGVVHADDDDDEYFAPGEFVSESDRDVQTNNDPISEPDTEVEFEEEYYHTLTPKSDDDNLVLKYETRY